MAPESAPSETVAARAGCPSLAPDNTGVRSEGDNKKLSPSYDEGNDDARISRPCHAGADTSGISAFGHPFGLTRYPPADPSPDGRRDRLERVTTHVCRPIGLATCLGHRDHQERLAQLSAGCGRDAERRPTGCRPSIRSDSARRGARPAASDDGVYRPGCRPQGHPSRGQSHPTREAVTMTGVLRRALAELAPPIASWLPLRAWERLTPAQLAAVLGSSPSRVRLGLPTRGG